MPPCFSCKKPRNQKRWQQRWSSSKSGIDDCSQLLISRIWRTFTKDEKQILLCTERRTDENTTVLRECRSAQATLDEEKSKMLQNYQTLKNPSIAELRMPTSYQKLGEFILSLALLWERSQTTPNCAQQTQHSTFVWWMQPKDACKELTVVRHYATSAQSLC